MRNLCLVAEGGVVAEATVFSDGLAVLHWTTGKAHSLEVYATEKEMLAIREKPAGPHFQEGVPS